MLRYRPHSQIVVGTYCHSTGHTTASRAEAPGWYRHPGDQGMLWAAESGTKGMHALGSRVWHQGPQDEVGGAGIPVYTQAPAKGTVQGRVPLSMQVVM